MSLFLSIVLTGRNDDYGGDFRERFFRTLRFNHRELTARGIAHEFVLTEWAPDPARRLLVDFVKETIPDIADEVFTAYIVDPAYQDALTLNPHLKYLEYVAKNVAIRRASGDYILASNCDVYFGRRILDVLAGRALQPRTVYRAVRHDLEMSATPSDWDALEDPGSLDAPPRPLKLPLMLGGTGDFVLLDRETFHELRGFNEVYRLARMGVDANFMLKAFSSGVQIVDIGGPVYHVNHVGSYRVSRDTYAGREHEAPWGNRQWHYHGVVYENPPSWGLRDAPMRALGGGRWRLDFDLHAVPPLVDLRRVVLAVDRVGQPQLRRYKK